jgi:hypothetical protein
MASKSAKKRVVQIKTFKAGSRVEVEEEVNKFLETITPKSFLNLQWIVTQDNCYVVIVTYLAS